MRSGSWPVGHAYIPGARVTVDAASKEVDSVTVSREIPRVLPGQVASVGGVTAATGDAAWAQAENVTARVPTPWTRKGYPSRGERVGVWAAQGGVEHKVFTGLTDGTTGRFSDPARSTALVDDIDQLNAAVSHIAIAAVMPPLSTTNDEHRRMVGIIPSYITDVCARAAGFYATPPMDGYCVVSAPLMGSTWPEKGTLKASYRSDDVGGWNRYQPWWTTTAWGCAFHRGIADYNPDLSVWDGKITTARPMSVTMMVPPTMGTSAYVSVIWQQGAHVRLSVTSSRTLNAQIVDSAGTVTTVASLSPAAAGAWETATLQAFIAGTGASLRLRLTTDTGATIDGTVSPPSEVVTNPMYRVRVYAPEGAPLGGVQVSATSQTPAASRFTRTAVIGTKDALHRLDAVPAIASEKAIDILKAQSAAESAAMWIDEDGVFRWVNRHQFTAGAVVRTLTAADDLLDVVFRLDGQDVRRKVTVKYRKAATSTSKSSRIICYEGQKDELEAGDSQDVWIAPGPDEDWIAVDSTPLTIYGGYNVLQFNKGQGSWTGFIGLDADGNEVNMGNDVDQTQTFARIGPASWRYTLNVVSLPAGVNRISTSTRDEDGTDLKRKYQGMGLPLLRCMGVTTWSDQEHAVGNGPAWAPELEHDVGWFIQDAAEIVALADWIAGQTNAPHPVVESVTIIPDPRLQLGDKVKIVDDARTGVSITGVIIGITQAITGGDHTMSLKLLVTLVETPHITLDEFDAWYAGMTLDQIDALFAGSTLDQIDATPLR